MLFYFTAKGWAKLPLRGLCFDDVWDLYNTHKDELEEFYKNNNPAREADEDEESSQLSPQAFIILFIAELPKVAADIIARGLDSDKHTPRKVARWPIEIQHYTLMKLITLTLNRDEAVKKAFGLEQESDESAEEDATPPAQDDEEITLGKIVLGYRRDRSLLLAHGQPNAGKYVLGFMIDEALIAAQRQKERQATENDLLMMALLAMFDKEAGKNRAEVIAELRGAS